MIVNTRRMKGIILFGLPLGWFNMRDRLNYRGLSLGRLFRAVTDDRGGWSVTLAGVKIA
jgi:hypothetical protein